jgi:hypothetical protein
LFATSPIGVSECGDRARVEHDHRHVTTASPSSIGWASCHPGPNEWPCR